MAEQGFRFGEQAGTHGGGMEERRCLSIELILFTSYGGSTFQVRSWVKLVVNIWRDSAWEFVEIHRAQSIFPYQHYYLTSKFFIFSPLVNQSPKP